MIRRLYFGHPLLLIALSGALTSWAGAEDKNQAPASLAAPTSEAGSSVDVKQMAFLGIVVEPVHPAVVTHLKSVNSSEQGLIVTMVSADSPADHAGVKVHDIVLAYDDQKLFTPEQLVRLVASDRPGREVKLSLIHEGRPETLMVKLGERSVASIEALSNGSLARSPIRSARPRMIRRHQLPAPQILGWDEFDSITIKKLDKGHFQVNVAHPDRSGTLQQHEYQGTRDEIRARIEADQRLSPHERTQLLHGLGMHTPRLIAPDDEHADF
ncbi:S1C family serine protease [Schlesneria paludicola]|uniref:S1C family serine protease n=1 Tax=Schlesneria paludicola TaxID=360056 RepID=UPI00029AC8C4|nr:PDZ domain-containing protein [Schlesneria paludicola]